MLGKCVLMYIIYNRRKGFQLMYSKNSVIKVTHLFFLGITLSRNRNWPQKLLFWWKVIL